MKQAEDGIEELQAYVDTLIIIPNQNLFRLAMSVQHSLMLFTWQTQCYTKVSAE